jgi:hypothetical protein
VVCLASRCQSHPVYRDLCDLRPPPSVFNGARSDRLILCKVAAHPSWMLLNPSRLQGFATFSVSLQWCMERQASTTQSVAAHSSWMLPKAIPLTWICDLLRRVFTGDRSDRPVLRKSVAAQSSWTAAKALHCRAAKMEARFPRTPVTLTPKTSVVFLL